MPRVSYAECRVFFIVIHTVAFFNAMLGLVMLNVIMLSVTVPMRQIEHYYRNGLA
jgi:hypothetical protein